MERLFDYGLAIMGGGSRTLAHSISSILIIQFGSQKGHRQRTLPMVQQNILVVDSNESVLKEIKKQIVLEKNSLQLFMIYLFMKKSQIPLNVSHLADEFGISKRTIMRDLKILEYNNLVIKINKGYWIVN